MVQLKVDKFCGLATSPSWQAWLYRFDATLFNRFTLRLRESRGCNQNRDLMVETLKEIKTLNGEEKLLEFIHQHYSSMLMNELPMAVPQSDDTTEVFGYHNPYILTYPRRVIFSGEETELRKKVNAFLLDKIKSDFVIVHDKAYIEYLLPEDTHLKDSIPLKNWKIGQWRLRHQK